jgi:hypothetical protein
LAHFGGSRGGGGSSLSSQEREAATGSPVLTLEGGGGGSAASAVSAVLAGSSPAISGTPAAQSISSLSASHTSTWAASWRVNEGGLPSRDRGGMLALALGRRQPAVKARAAECFF